MSIPSGNIPEINIKIEFMHNTCRFCIQQNINLISIATKLSLNESDEDTNAANVIISILELINECFGLDLQVNLLFSTQLILLS